MPVDPKTLLRGLDGQFLVPDWLTQQLQRRSPGVGVFYSKASWVITEAWKDNDPRRERIRTGEMDPRYAFDICGSLPVTVALDEAPAFIEAMLRGFDMQTWTGVRNAMRQWNTADGEGQDAAQYEQLRGAIDNDMGSFVPSAGFFPSADIAPKADVPDLSNVPNTISVAQLESLKKARAVRAEKLAAAKAEPVPV